MKRGAMAFIVGAALGFVLAIYLSQQGCIDLERRLQKSHAERLGWMTLAQEYELDLRACEKELEATQ